MPPKRLELDLAIRGFGAATPGGLGVGALLSKEPWPVQEMAGIRTGSPPAPVLKLDLQQERWRRWQEHPRLRRASPISLFMAEAADQALSKNKVEASRMGIAAAFCTGSLVYSRRFFQGFRKDGKRFASPILFPETVHNAPASHLASLLKISGPCYSHIGDESAWVSAIRTAAGWLAGGRLDAVLVVAAEELDEVSVDGFQAIGWLRQRSSFVPAEGAGAMLLARADASDPLRITGLAEGFAYRNRTEARRAGAACLGAFDSELRVHRSAQRNWLAPIEKELTADRARPDALPGCGEAFCASASWQTIRAAELLGPGERILVPVWGLNEQVSALQIERREKN